MSPSTDETSNESPIPGLATEKKLSDLQEHTDNVERELDDAKQLLALKTEAERVENHSNSSMTIVLTIIGSIIFLVSLTLLSSLWIHPDLFDKSIMPQMTTIITLLIQILSAGVSAFFGFHLSERMNKNKKDSNGK